MSRLTGADTYGLMEAYQAVYAPQELAEEQVWEEVENWVNDLIEEGYDLSDYTWEEMYEGYITEILGMPGAQNAGANLRQQFGKTRRDIGGAISDVVGSGLRGVIGQTTTSKNPISQAYNAATRGVTAGGRAAISGVGGFLTGKPESTATGPAKPKVNPNSSIDKYNTKDPDGTIRSRLKVGPKIVGPKTVGPGSAGGSSSGSGGSGGSTPRPTSTTSTAPKPTATTTPTAPKPAAGAQTGDKEKDMATFAKANPKLAAAQAEKDRIRGTSQTDNPSMKDMTDKMPMTPSVQSPTLAKDLDGGSGNQSLLDNPNASKAATPKKPITSSFDYFDAVKGYLIDEGYADTEEAAERIMGNMSDAWVRSIIG